MRRLAVALVFAVVSLPLGAGAAYAHGGGPKTAIPAADEQVAELPQRVELDFGEPLRELPVAISVLSPDGEQMTQGIASVEGTVARIDLDPDAAAPAGTYTVTYQVVFEDGAALRSKYEFALTAARQASGSSTEGNQSGPSQAPKAQVVGSGGTQWQVLAGILGGLLLLGGLALYLTLALSRKETDGPED